MGRLKIANFAKDHKSDCPSNLFPTLCFSLSQHIKHTHTLDLTYNETHSLSHINRHIYLSDSPSVFLSLQTQTHILLSLSILCVQRLASLSFSFSVFHLKRHLFSFSLSLLSHAVLFFLSSLSLSILQVHKHHVFYFFLSFMDGSMFSFSLHSSCTWRHIYLSLPPIFLSFSLSIILSVVHIRSLNLLLAKSTSNERLTPPKVFDRVRP